MNKLSIYYYLYCCLLDATLCPNTIAANNLSPQKAAVLLRLALLNTTDKDELIRIFATY